jgi:outer membrane protein OmpA-like peptidoglycan-associated protein
MPIVPTTVCGFCGLWNQGVKMNNDDDASPRVVLWVLLGVALVVGPVLALAVAHSRSGLPVAKPAPAVAMEAAASAAVATDSASVVVDHGVVKFYFASGQADLAEGAVLALESAIGAAKAGKTLILTGYHDATGSPEFNAGLAKRRAVTVRDALLGAGVDGARIVLQKPQEMVGSGSAAEARRVEVSTQE